jgi:peptidyl-prolyl cis-trans isomerase SurA
LQVDTVIKSNPLLFSFDDKKFYYNDFKQYLINENITEGKYSDYYQSWAEYEIIKLEDSRLEEKYPEFNLLMKEYHDGLLFFNIMEEKIWKYAAEDSVGLRDFYSKNKTKFLWEERFKGLIVTCKNKEAREEAEKYFEAQIILEEVEYLINKEETLIEIKQGKWEKGDNPVIDYFIWNGQLSSSFNPELTLIRGDVIDPEPKSLDEAKGLYISAYQDYIEKEWIKSLRKKYKIKISKKLLKTVSHV